MAASCLAASCFPDRICASCALPSLHAHVRQMLRLLHAAGHLSRPCCPCWAVCSARWQCWWICCSMPYCGCVTTSCATSDALSNRSRLQQGEGAGLERSGHCNPGQRPVAHLQLQMEHIAQLSTVQLQRQARQHPTVTNSPALSAACQRVQTDLCRGCSTGAQVRMGLLWWSNAVQR